MMIKFVEYISLPLSREEGLDYYAYFLIIANTFITLIEAWYWMIKDFPKAV